MHAVIHVLKISFNNVTIGLLNFSCKTFSRAVKMKTYLRRNVVGCTTKRHGKSIATYLLFAHTKVRQFDVAFFVEQYIVQLQISATTQYKNDMIRRHGQHLTGNGSLQTERWTAEIGHIQCTYVADISSAASAKSKSIWQQVRSQALSVKVRVRPNPAKTDPSPESGLEYYKSAKILSRCNRNLVRRLNAVCKIDSCCLNLYNLYNVQA